MQYEQRTYENRVINRDLREQHQQTNRADEPMYPRRKSYMGALLLALLLIILLAGGTLFGNSSFSKQRSVADRTFAVTGHSQLTVSNSSGLIYVHAGNTNHIIVHSTKFVSGFGVSLDDIHTNYVQNGNTISILSYEDNGPLIGGEREVNFDITVPGTTDLTIHNGSGEVHIADIASQASASTGSGDIKASNIHGQMLFSTGSGDIQAEQATLTGQSSLRTGSGKISLTGSLDPNGNYRIETGSGNVQLRLPADAAFQLKTKIGTGTLHNSFNSDQVGTGPYAALSIQTGSGDIELDKQ
jgi:Toastrack DUF4097